MIDIAILFLGQEDSAKTAFAEFFDYFILVKVVIIILIFPDILLVKVQTRPSESHCI